jgi:hypothetical protein
MLREFLRPGFTVGELESPDVVSVGWNNFGQGIGCHRGDASVLDVGVSGIGQAVAEYKDPTDIGIIICIGKTRYAKYQDGEADYCRVAKVSYQATRRLIF